MPQYDGQCSCGRVQFRVSAERVHLVNCHCTLCRRLNGGAFSSYVTVPSVALAITAGSDNIGVYSATENADKRFCRTCGSPLYNTNKKFPGRSMIYLGSLHEHAKIDPRINVFCASKLGWVDSVASIESLDNGGK